MRAPIDHARLLTTAAAIAAVAIVVDAVAVAAPGLAILAAPFVAGMLLERRRPRAAVVTLAVGGLLWTGIAANYAASTDALDWAAGDVVGILVGGPAAAVTLVVALLSMIHRGHRHHVA